MTVAIETEGRGQLAIKITGVASTSGGGIGAVVNPEGVNVVILRATLYNHVLSTASATLSVGVAAAATTSAADLLNALNINTGGSIAVDTAFNCFVMENGAKTILSSGVPAVWTKDYYLTFTGSATTLGYEGYLFVEYVRAI